MTHLQLLAVLMIVSFGLADCSQARPTSSPLQYMSPQPGAEMVLEETTIIFRPGGPVSSANTNIYTLLRIEGSRSGIHTYDMTIAGEGRILIFKPHIPFQAGERVSVAIGPGLIDDDGKAIAAFSYSFTITAARGIPEKDFDSMGLSLEHPPPPSLESSRPGSCLRDSRIVLPSNFPEITITEFDAPDTGYIFLSDFSNSDTTVGNYLMILDNTGAPVFFRELPDQRGRDFKKHPNGLLSYNGGGRVVLMDSTYTEVDTFQAGNGYATDGHDFQLLPNGNGLLMSYDPQTVDMSELVEGGDPAANVIGLIIQEVDPNDNVVFQWRSWDHFSILDATHTDFTYHRIDYVHGNSVEQDSDGNILISCRHMDEVTKINRLTGDIIWRFGGLNNQFTVTNDSLMFSWQHDCRRIANGNVTIFDNGNWNNPKASRAIEYELDEVNMIATLVWQFPDSPDYFSQYAGNAQRLPNGNTVVGWGGNLNVPHNAALVEVRPDGSKAFGLSFPDYVVSYRAFRFPWNGIAARPELWAESEGGTHTLHFKKFGDNSVDQYYVYQGETDNPTSMTLVDSTSENTALITGLECGYTYYFRVTATDSQGSQSEFSNSVEFYQVICTGVELVDGRNPIEGLLLRNHPNPFNPTTTISFGLPVNSRVDLSIHNVIGREVRTLLRGPQLAGFKSCVWDGKDNAGRAVPSGIYFCRLDLGDSMRSHKMILLK